jgi:hypothetical protein
MSHGPTSQDLADITGALDATTACTQTADGEVILTGRICNRGLRGIGSTWSTSATATTTPPRSKSRGAPS